MHRLALVFVFLPTLALAVPDQMLNQIDFGLKEYRIETDVETLTNAQATAIFFELTSTDHRRTGDWLRTRQRLLNIIRKGEDF